MQTSQTLWFTSPPALEGDNGSYHTHGTITGPGIHNHVQYIDYQIWRCLLKLREMGIENETLIIVTTDNGTWGHGKHNPDLQKGCHVPMIV